jgi:ADP-ribosylglycohydrolase
MNRSIWFDGMMGVIVGDALGCPVQFMERSEIAGREEGPVKGMESGGVFEMPQGTWTDDSSMALAALDSIRELGEVDLEDIMTRFVDWYEEGEYTPFGEAFDIGNTGSLAIENFERERDPMTCGGTSEWSNGNGSLMRIMPVCLYAYDRKLPVAEAIKTVHEVGGLTHNHLRAKIACGLYYFCVRSS